MQSGAHGCAISCTDVTRRAALHLPVGLAMQLLFIRPTHDAFNETERVSMTESAAES